MRFRFALIAISCAFAQPRCPKSSVDDATFDFHFPREANDCFQLTTGFSGYSGNFASLSASTSDLLGLHERITAAAEIGVRSRRATLAFTAPPFVRDRIETGFNVHVERFHYDQLQESSILGFDREIPEFKPFSPDTLTHYVSYSYGTAAFASIKIHQTVHLGVTYSYEISNFKTLSGSTSDLFRFLDAAGSNQTNALNGIRTSRVTPAFTYSTVRELARPASGTILKASVGIAGLGGTVDTIEPALDAKYFHPGFARGHVIALRLRGAMITGYNGHSAPPFARYFLAGEDEIRGFDSWSITPMVYVPSSGVVAVLNPDGTPRMQRVIGPDGQIAFVNATLTIPVSRLVSPGGDTKVIGNLEYRIPLKRAFTVVAFADAGENRASFPNQLHLEPGRIGQLNSQYPEGAFPTHYPIESGSQEIRMSTGLELQARVPKVNAPLRFYWAYNPLAYRAVLQPPSVADRSYFPNAATTIASQAIFGAPTVIDERRHMFRFCIGRTF